MRKRPPLGALLAPCGVLSFAYRAAAWLHRSFVLSPLYRGGAATGRRRADAFMDDGMTLPTAAISATPSHRRSGMGGVGVALNPLVSSLVVLLNLRMGYRVPNPRRRRPGPPPHGRPGVV